MIANVIFSSALQSNLIDDVVRFIHIAKGEKLSKYSESSSNGNAIVFNTSPSKSALSVHSHDSQHHAVLL